MRSVTLNLANKFSQCIFSVTEHYDLFSGLLFNVKRDGVDRVTSYRTDRNEPTEKLLQEKLKATRPTLIYMLPIMLYTTSRQHRVEGHFKLSGTTDAVFTKLPRPLAKDHKTL